MKTENVAVKLQKSKRGTSSRLRVTQVTAFVFVPSSCSSIVQRGYRHEWVCTIPFIPCSCRNCRVNEVLLGTKPHKQTQSICSAAAVRLWRSLNSSVLIVLLFLLKSSCTNRRIINNCKWRGKLRICLLILKSAPPAQEDPVYDYGAMLNDHQQTQQSQQSGHQQSPHDNYYPQQQQAHYEHPQPHHQSAHHPSPHHQSPQHQRDGGQVQVSGGDVQYQNSENSFNHHAVSHGQSEEDIAKKFLFSVEDFLDTIRHLKDEWTSTGNTHRSPICNRPRVLMFAILHPCTGSNALSMSLMSPLTHLLVGLHVVCSAFSVY